MKKSIYIYIYIHIYIHIYESLCCTPETNTTLQINDTTIFKYMYILRKYIFIYIYKIQFVTWKKAIDIFSDFREKD